jgi:murein DD-endopeptidase MepM/ murein hydrolase activator NlpD
MQLMWVSGPTASVKTVSITAKKVAVFAIASASLLVLLGILLHFIGFRLAVEVSPGLARSLGGVTTEAEQQRQEAVYKERLEKLRESLNDTMQQIHQLEATKNRFMDIATPVNLRDKISHKDEGRGGPWVAPRLQGLTGVLSDDLNASMDDFSHVNEAVKHLQTSWDTQLKWVSELPTGIPLQSDFRITSGFGIRNDPFTGQLAMHEGLDFVASHGTPVVSTANGVVTRSALDGSFGNVIEVSHIEGYTTRYAHLSRRDVQVGDKVARGEKLGLLGSTGRSTGPHLHYEVLFKDRVVNPYQVLQQTAAQ